MGDDSTSTRRGLVSRMLDVIERVGNRLPDPLTLFVILAAAVPLVSCLVAMAGWTVIHPKTGEAISAVNLMSGEGLRRMLTEAVKNFTNFPPLGTVLVAMIGIGVAERSGLIGTLLRMMVMAVPKGLITAALVFAGVMSSVAADAGYVVLTPLGAVLFAGLGRHPLAGLAAAFAGVSGGFSANLMVSTLDVLLGGFTEPAAQLLDPEYTVLATANWYFMIASTVLITFIGWFVTEKIVEPRLGTWHATDGDGEEHRLDHLSRREVHGALAALASAAITAAVVFLLVYPEAGVLRDPQNAQQPLKPFYDSLVPLLLIVFIVPGLVYGLWVGSIRSDRTVAKMTGDTMATMGAYIVLAFAAAQFVAYFGWSNLGLMLAIGGANLLKTTGLEGMPLLLAFILVAAFVNLFIGSASAKWAIMAPVFVPMLMQFGISPEMTQAAYRIGDSTTNIITPLMPYFPIIIAFGQKYDKNLRLGTLVSAMLPYSIAFLIGWMLLLGAWYVLDLPLGPGAPMSYAP